MSREFDFGHLVDLCRRTHEESQSSAARVMDTYLVTRNWLFGWYIVEYEQRGADRAEYGSRLLAQGFSSFAGGRHQGLFDHPSEALSPVPSADANWSDSVGPIRFPADRHFTPARGGQRSAARESTDSVCRFSSDFPGYRVCPFRNESVASCECPAFLRRAKMQNNRRVYKTTVAGQLFKHLGLQMYSGAVPAISELISNAYDAMARNVWIEIPTGRPIQQTDKIVVKDDGHGMNYVDCNSLYLTVGRDRRSGATEWAERI